MHPYTTKSNSYRKLRFVGPIVRSFMFSRLAFLFELAVNFVKVKCVHVDVYICLCDTL